MIDPATLQHWQCCSGWKRAAAEAVKLGRVRYITGKDGWLYLARFWLHEPRVLPSGEFESGNSAMLHWIVQGDDTPDLHDHPWSFQSIVVDGYYYEQQADGKVISRARGDHKRMEATDCHRVHGVGPGGCMTLVVTGKWERDWGFHKDGQWIPWREYLGIKTEAND